MSDFGSLLKKIFIYEEKVKDEGFILKDKASSASSDIDTIDEGSDDNNESGKNSKSSSSMQRDEPDPQKKPVSIDIENNLINIKKIFSYPDNSDFVIRKFVINLNSKNTKTFVVFFDGLVDRDVVDRDILQPMMVMSQLKDVQCKGSPVNCILRHLLPQNQTKLYDNFEETVDDILTGSCAIFVNGSSQVIISDVKGWEHRNVERPNTEMVIRGPQEGFTEIVRINTALIRKIVRDDKLIAENIPVGKRSKTPCTIMYIKDIANKRLVDEVRRRLKSLNVDYVIDSGEIEQLIEDNTFLPAPQVLATERPDRVASLIVEGRVAIVVNGSPFVLVVPVTLFELLRSAEDTYIRFPYSNFVRFIRLFGTVLALILPALYIAITTFHQEMIPTDLLLAIENSREKVPFPSVIEILIMELSFELIREAGVRIPTPIGPTLGIIGALILGQAAVSASIVSPILIIIVALTGIGSFAIPSFSLSFAVRILRFIYILLAALAGFLGITAGLFILLLWLASSKSFGVRFLAPIAPLTSDDLTQVLSRAPIWKQEMRPDFLNTFKRKQQAYISRSWINRGKNKRVR